MSDEAHGRPLFTDDQAGDLASDSLGGDRTYAHLLWSGEPKPKPAPPPLDDTVHDAWGREHDRTYGGIGRSRDRERERAPGDAVGTMRISAADYRRWTHLEEENTKLLADKTALDQSNTTLRLELAAVQVANDRLATRNTDVEDRMAFCGQWCVHVKRRLIAADDKTSKLQHELGKTHSRIKDMQAADPLFEELTEELSKALRRVASLRNVYATAIGELQNCIANSAGAAVPPEPCEPAPPAPPAPSADATLPQEE
jgi:hypothetical protein